MENPRMLKIMKMMEDELMKEWEMSPEMKEGERKKKMMEEVLPSPPPSTRGKKKQGAAQGHR